MADGAKIVMSEREHIESAQDEVHKAKLALRDVKKHINHLIGINTEEDRPLAANAAMAARGGILRIMGDLDAWHADVTVALHENYPEFAEEIQTRGPGGGR